jgi:hypothetical protein
MKLVTAQTSAPKKWLMWQDVEIKSSWKLEGENRQNTELLISTILRNEEVKLNYSEQKKSKISITHTGIINNVFFERK